MKKIKSSTPEIPPLDLGTDEDRELGATVADVKIAAMKEGFDDRYQDGVDRFFQKQIGDVEADRQLGSQIAAAMIEERRKTLITIAIKTSLFAGVAGLAALIVGFSPTQSAIVFIPSTIAAICTSKKL